MTEQEMESQYIEWRDVLYEQLGIINIGKGVMVIENNINGITSTYRGNSYTFPDNDSSAHLNNRLHKTISDLLNNFIKPKWIDYEK